MSTEAVTAGAAAEGGSGANLQRDDHHSPQDHSLNEGPHLPQPHIPICDSGPKEEIMHKNRLQEYVQSSGIALPIYNTFNEGSQHAPAFRSIVTVDGMTFIAPSTFRRRKEAEQNVAKVALEALSRKMKNDGGPLISGDTMFCKSILHEYAAKMGVEKPAYSTVQTEGMLPAFLSTLVFEGKTYHGDLGKNKKEAEQLAARAAIQSILETSNSGTIMSNIIKSKEKFLSALQKINSVTPQNNILDCLMQSVNHSNSSTMKAKEVQGNVISDELCNKSLQQQISSTAAVQQLCSDHQRPKGETICEEGSHIVAQGTVHSTTGLLGSPQQTCDPNSSQDNCVNTVISPPLEPSYSSDTTATNKEKRKNIVHEDHNPKKAKTDEQYKKSPPPPKICTPIYKCKFMSQETVELFFCFLMMHLGPSEWAHPYRGKELC